MKTSPNAPARIANGLLLLRNRHFLLFDILIFCVSPIMAIILRTDDLRSPLAYALGLLIYTVLAVALRVGLSFKTGLYRRYWRFAGIDELTLITAIMIFSTTLILLFYFGAYLIVGSYAPDWLTTMPPRSIPFIDALLALSMVGGLRFSIRMTERWHHKSPSGQVKRVLIVGAGVAGSMCLREIQNNPEIGLVPIGFIDDNPEKGHANIRGVQVLGNRTDIPHLVRENKISEILLAMPSASGKEVRQIIDICKHAGITTKTMPSMTELLEGAFDIQQMRNIQLEDLLRREPIETDRAAITNLIEGQTVLVTGGGGSIGSELCRQILRCQPKKLVILGHGENSVFQINRELLAVQQNRESQTDIRTVIADIRFPDCITAIFQQEMPDIIFHAAAHKHVPLMEQNPSEAITNNVLGTRNVVRAALVADVERFVMISTDKAVNPTNVMGASKRSAELTVHQAAKESGKAYVAVRFGNVLGSRGSVVHTFNDQIARGGPITVTHPDMCRFFMTIPEAVQLVLQAGVLGTGGEVFVLDMGEPIKIVNMARDLLRLHGLQEGRDIDIAFSKLRPGEKLFEELFIEGESYARTPHEKIFLASNASNFVPHDLDALIAQLAEAANRMDADAIRSGLKALVPEYTPVPPAGIERVAPEANVEIAKPKPRTEKLTGALAELSYATKAHTKEAMA